MIITQHDYAVVIRQEDDSVYILLLSGATLPHMLNERHFWQTCRPVNQAMQQHYGLDVVTIRPLQNSFHQLSDDAGEIRTVYLVQARSGDIPANARWHTITQLPDLSAQMPLTSDTLRDYLGQEVRPAWYHYGWVDRLLDATHEITLQALEQIRSWERSSIWRLPTKTGDHYLKLLPEMFSHEAQLTIWLKKHFPDAIPQVLPEIMPQSMRTQDYGQVDLSSMRELPVWIAAIRRYAKIQLQCIEDASELIDLGVPQRGLNWMNDHLDMFLMDDANLTGGSNPLTPSEIVKLSQQLPRLKQIITQLQQHAIPETLEHGDLWAGQIIISEGRTLFTDWSDSTITHPFFSLVFFLTDIETQFPDELTARQQLEDAYLEVWDSFGDVRSAYQAAWLLADVFNAMRYHYDILPHMGQQWEMHNMIAYDLRLLLSKIG